MEDNRQRALALLQDVLRPLVKEGKEVPMSVKLESEIMNYVSRETFGGFDQKIYFGRTRYIVNALRNFDLVGKLRTREIWDTSFITAEQIDPSGSWATTRRRLEEEERTRMEYSRMLSEKRSDGLLRCSKCKSSKTDFIEVQTRSADEPMTIFITCRDCGSRTKR